MSMPGMMVCMGRLPGSRQLACSGSREKERPRQCNRMPVSGTTKPEPKGVKMLLMKLAALPWASPTAR